MLIEYLSKHREPNTKQRFGPRKKQLNGNIFAELFYSDLDEKMTLASYKRERNKNKAASREADNLFALFTASRTG